MAENKKRKRITKVCDFCRKRKVRCDLGNPCSSCVKYKQTVCNYGEFNETNDALTGQLQFLKEKVRRLEDNMHADNNPSTTREFEFVIQNQSPAARDNVRFTNPYDTINFYDGYTSIIDREPLRRRHSSPLSWISLIKADNALSKLWLHMKTMKQMKPEKGIHLQTEEKDGKVANPIAEQNFQERVTTDEGYDDVKLYKDQAPNLKPKFNLICKAKSLGLSFYQGGLDTELELIEKIRLVFPNQKSIWLLINRFFTHIYIHYPFIDETKFKEQCESLIGKEDYLDQPLPFVRAEKKLDFAILGLLLIVLRLSYLSLFSNIAQLHDDDLPETDSKIETLKFLIDNPINIDVIDVSQLCLNQFNLTRGINMAIMQLALYDRIYRVIAPEDGEGADGGDSMVMNASLIQMARSIGLHREPDLFPDHCNDIKINNLGRKMWYYLIIMDYTKCLNDGSVCNIHPDSFDTKAPYCSSKNANCLNFELERVTCQAMQGFSNVIVPMHKLISLVSTVKGNVNIVELNEVMNAMEDFYSKGFGKLLGQIYDTDLSVDELYTRALGMKIYFTLNFVAVSIHFHLFNYYEKRRNVDAAYYYIKNIFERSVRDLMPFYFAFLERSNTIFKNFTDLPVTPGFEQIIHKSLLVLTSIYIRVNFSIAQYTSYEGHRMKMMVDQKFAEYFGKLNHFMKVLQRAISVFSGLIGRLSHRYYYAWRVSKGHNYICDFLANSDFFVKYQDSIDYTEFTFTSEMLDEIISIVETSLSKIKDIKKNKVVNNEKEPFVKSNIKVTKDDLSKSRKSNISPVISNSSTDSFDNGDSKSNEEIDRMWLQLMTNKKVTDLNDWTNKLSFTDGNVPPGVENRRDGYYDNNIQQPFQTTSFGPQVDNNINIDGGVRHYNYSANMISDLFDGLPVDEIFREFT